MIKQWMPMPLVALTLLFGARSVNAYPAYSSAWTKSQCDSYSYHGLSERYVFGGDKGWIDNNAWDSSSTEGVDCSAYTARVWALPGYIGEHTFGSHPYSTYSYYPGSVPHTVRLSGFDSMVSWDLWVYNASTSGCGPGNHTGIVQTKYADYIITREAQCSACGVVRKTRYQSSLQDWCTRYYRRAQWGGSTPSAPSSLKATTVSSSQIKLTWVDNSGIETGQRIEYIRYGMSTWAFLVNVGANVESYTHSGLLSGTLYKYRVRAYNAAGPSPWSNTAQATTKDVIPAAPTSLTATAVSDVQINLGWACSAANEDGFRIYRSTDGVTYSQIATAGINAVSYANTGLAGNRKYYYKVYSYNTAGNSSASNVASDTTAPQAPSALAVSTVAGTTNWNKLNLTWTDNSSAEAGFKIERGTAAAGPFTQIATNAASDNTYTDSGLLAQTTYYYRVRSYNSNGNSAYSAVASKATPNAPPVLAAIGNKTVSANSTLAFTATASDPNKVVTTTTFATFEGSADGTQELMFRKPSNSSTTIGFIDTAVNDYSTIKTGLPAGGSGTKAVKVGWNFKTGAAANYWVRLNTFNAPSWPNPTIALDQILRVKVYSSKAIKLGLGVRETGTTAAYGANGGTTGTIDWAGVTNVVSGNPIPNHLIPANTWTTVSFNIPFEPQAAFTGDGKVVQTGAKGVLEHFIIKGEGGVGAYTVWLDDLAVVAQNTLAYSLDAGAPAGASIERRTGKFTWTPTLAQAGLWNITVRVTDQGGAQDWETIKVTVLGTGNNPPTLATIGSKTVKELTALTFTASATEPDAGQTLTYSLDAGSPSGASINSSTGAFTWTPTEAQGPGSYPITVRVTDNGSPSSNDFETITITVTEVNTAPVLAAIANQFVNEGQTLNLTASATDSDIPANTITYSVEGPAGISINPSTGALTWTAPAGADTNLVTVTARDNGNPSLYAARSFTVTVNDQNDPPTLLVSPKNDYNMIAAFDECDDDGAEGHNNASMFRVPYFSATTTNFLDSTSWALLTNDFPRDEINSSQQALYVNFRFLSGAVNPWLRLSTFTADFWTNTHMYPNPTIDLGQHVRFKVWTDKQIKLALGVRETGTTVPIGFNGGTNGAIEWIGATASGSMPVPNRVIPAGAWTEVDFDLPHETIAAFPGSGNGVLASGKGVLEHLAIVPDAGNTDYTLYLDDFEVISVKTTNYITIDSGDTLQFLLEATDPDLPEQDLTFTMSGAPTNATLDGAEFVWTPETGQSGTTNVITFTVTDSGVPPMNSSQTVTIVVNKVNTPPRIARDENVFIEDNSGAPISIDIAAEDDDVPAQSLTFSIVAGPPGASINPTTGTFTWTPPSGLSTNAVTIRVTDNGVPSLWGDQTLWIRIVPTNNPPVLSLGTARATEPVVNYETFTNNTPNEQVMFKKPANSSTTTNFMDLVASNYTTVVTSFPAGNANAGAKALKAGWTFKTGIADYWVRLTTANTTFLPNPAINASARVKFDIYSDKQLKVALGIRETGTTAENGANGGTTGTIEFIGASGKQANGAPIPTRTVNANTWTTLEFDLPNEPKQAFTGDGNLTGGQQVLEHLALVGTTTGAHTVYLDNFEVVTTTALPGTVTVKANSTLTFTATASDPNPGSGITYDLDADFADAHAAATFNETNGVFNWTPGMADANTTNAITITASDNPTNGGIAKSDAKTFNIVVTSDTLATQSSESRSFIAGGDTQTIVWDSVAGKTYSIQVRAVDSNDWTSADQVTATGSVTSLSVTNDGKDSYYRIVETASAAADQ